MPFIRKILSKNLKFTKTFWLLTFSDLFSWGFYLIIATLAGVYLEKEFGSEVVKIIGIGGAISYLIRGTLQIPVSALLDRLKSDKDEIYVLTAGSFLMGFPFLFYPSISEPIHYYILQVIFSVGVALNLNPWRKLFATNLQDGKEAREYAVYDMINSFFIAGSIFIVGEVANINKFFFDAVLVVLGLLVMTGGVFSAMVLTDSHRKSNGNKTIEPTDETKKEQA